MRIVSPTNFSSTNTSPDNTSGFGQIEAIPLILDQPTVGDYDLHMPFSGSVYELIIRSNAGSANVSLKIESNSIIGMDFRAVDASKKTYVATSGNNFTAGQFLRLSIHAISSVDLLEITIAYRRSTNDPVRELLSQMDSGHVSVQLDALEVSGDVTANSFIGDGSQLTGISAGGGTWATITGNIGDNAQLTAALFSKENTIGLPIASGMVPSRSALDGTWTWVAKEDAIPLGDTTQYIKGDKTLGTLNTAAISGISAYSRAVIASADGTAFRANLNLGSMALQSDTGVSTGVMRGDGSGGLTPATAGTHYVAPTGTLALGGFSSITGALANANLPTSISLASGAFSSSLTLAGLAVATQQYVNDNAQGLLNRGPSVAATLTNITLSGAQTIDGVGVIAGDQVLVKNQTAPAENGLYIAAAGAWTRTINMDSWAEVPRSYTFITGGTQAGSSWNVTSESGGTLGVTAITWAQFGGGATYSASGGITLAGNAFSLSTMAANTVKGSVAGGAPADLTPAQARSVIGVGSLGQQDAGSVAITGGSIAGITDLAIADGGTGSSTAGGARTNLGLGSIATQAASAVAITGGSITGITDIAVADGGTGASTAASARANLGLIIGTDVQSYNAVLALLGGLTPAADRLPYFTGAGSVSLATFTSFGRSLVNDADDTAGRATLGLGSMATQDAGNVAITGGTAGVANVSIQGNGIGEEGFISFTPLNGPPFSSGITPMIYADATGRIVLAKSGTGSFGIRFSNSLLTAERSYTMPNAGGTVALTSNDLSAFANASGLGTNADLLGTGSIQQKARQYATTVYNDQINAFGAFKQTFAGGVHVGATTDPTTFTGTGKFAITAPDTATFSASQYNLNPDIPNDGRGAAIFLGKALTSGNSAHLTYRPRSTATSHSLSFGFFGFNDRMQVFRSGGATIGNPASDTDPGAGNLALGGAITAATQSTFSAGIALTAASAGTLVSASGASTMRNGVDISGHTIGDGTNQGAAFKAVHARAAQGLKLTGTLTGSSAPSNYAANEITVTDDMNLGTVGMPFSEALLLDHYFGGSAKKGGALGIYARSTLTAATNASSTNRNYCAVLPEMVVQSADGGTALSTDIDPVTSTSKGSVFALNPSLRLQSGATNYGNASGVEVNIELQTGSTSARKSGIAICANQDDRRQGKFSDCCILMSKYNASSPGAKVGIQFEGSGSTSAQGISPITEVGATVNDGSSYTSTGGTLIATKGYASVGTGIDFSSYDFNVTHASHAHMKWRSGGFIVGPKTFANSAASRFLKVQDESGNNYFIPLYT